MSERLRFSYLAPVFSELRVPEFRDRSRFVSTIDGLSFDESVIATYSADYKLNISLIEAPRYLARALSSYDREPLGMTRRGFQLALKFTFSSIYPGDEACSQQFDIGNSTHGHIEWWRYWVDDQAQSVLRKFIISSQIAWPYSRPPMDFFRFENQKLIRHQNVAFSPLIGAYPEAEDSAYEYLENIDILQVAAFVFGNRSRPYSDRIQKLIAYLSYMFTKNNGDARKAQIIWSCAALEAFYAIGASRRSEELRQNLPTFLSLDAKSVRRDVSKIYKRRSKFLHGNERLQSLFDYEDMGSNDEKEYRDTNIAVFFAMETLRKIVNDDLHDVDFGRVMKTSKT